MGRSRLLEAGLAGLAGLLLLAYQPAWFGGPVWDDHLLLAQNPVLRGDVPLGQAWSLPFHPFDIFYRPLVTVCLRAWEKLGAEPVLVHGFSLALHLASSAAILYLARKAGAGRSAAFVAAALFALHPVQTEAVAWMAGLGDVLVTALALGAAIALWPPSGPDRTPARLRLPVGLLAALGAVQSKETAILILPVLAAGAIVTSKWRPGRGSRGTVRGRSVRLCPAGQSTVLGLIGIGALHLVLRNLALGADWYELSPGAAFRPDPAQSNLGGFDPTRSIVVLGTYVRQIVLPNPSIAHVVELPDPGDARFWLAALGVVVATLGTIVLRKNPWAWIWSAWIGAALLPAVVWAPPGTQLVSDRYLYLPSAGLAVWGALLASRLARGPSRSLPPQHSRTAAALLATVLVLVAASATRHRAHDWGAEEQLYRREAAREPRSAPVVANLGFLLRNSGRADEARDLYRQTRSEIDSDASFYRTRSQEEAWGRILFELGLLELEAGRWDEAESAWRRADRDGVADERGLASLGAMLGRMGRMEEAIGVLERAVKSFPVSVLVRNNLARAYYETGRLGDADREWRQVLESDGGNEAALRGLSLIRESAGATSPR